ncbi:hypothetical protein OIO90_001315 [Microbotryomycetes sp. JL221]|nr:hypothetical protein OIO90_001315 [Microbotryomycetes sp. JL221]
MAQDLVLDPAIRDWVLLPLTAIMLLSGLIRHYVALLMHTPGKKQELKAIREQRALARGALLRNNASHLDPAAFNAFKTHLQLSYDNGTYLKEPKKSADSKTDKPTPPPNPLADPKAMEGMMDMFKKQAVGFLPQTLLMYYISYFFNGFVLTRLPFPLTVRFKAMLQRGIDTPDMDASWVSSVSWYFLCLFGLTPVYRLLLGQDNAADDSLNPLQSMPGAATAPTQAGQSPLHSFTPPANQPPAMPGQPQPDFDKLYKTEKDNLDLIQFDWIGTQVEDRVLQLFAR